MKSLIVTALLITSIGYYNVFKEGGNIQTQKEFSVEQSSIETAGKSIAEEYQKNDMTSTNKSTQEKSKQMPTKTKNQTTKKVKSEKKASTSNTKKQSTSIETQKKSESPKSIKVPINSNSYTKLDGGYAMGGQTVEIPKDWNY